MNSPSWMLQIYKMADLAAQESVARLLAHSGELAVEGRTCERGSYLIVESSDEEQARTVYEFVMTVDPFAVLTHTAKGPDEVAVVRRRTSQAPVHMPVGGRRMERVGGQRVA